MIHVDRREGSSQMAVHLRALGAATSLETLDFGDFYFDGYGPDNRRESIGIEYKTIHDLIACMDDGRFAGHQLPGMLDLFDKSYLVLEGFWRPGPRGELQTMRGDRWIDLGHGQRRYSYSELAGFLNTISNQGGFTVLRTTTPIESAHAIYCQYRWWSKGWTDHKALKVIHVATLDGRIQDETRMFAVKKDSPKHRAKCIVLQLPKLGYERAVAAVDYFAAGRKSIRDMFMAGPNEWAKIDGIGKGIANEVEEVISAKLR